MSSTPSQYGNFGPPPDRPDERGYRPPQDSQPFDHAPSPGTSPGSSGERFSAHAAPTYPPPPLAVPYGYAPPPGSAPPTHPVLVLGAPGNNGMGIAGFVVSLVSLVVCGGVLWPISLGLSIAGMKREPKGLAIAGLVISCVSAMLFFAMLLPFFILPLIVGFSAATSSANSSTSTQVESRHMAFLVTNYYSSYNEMPASLADIPGLSTYATFDRWSTPYRLTVGEGGAFSIDSAGPDKTFDTADDLVYHDSVTPPTALSPASTPAASNDGSPDEPALDQPASDPSPTEDP